MFSDSYALAPKTLSQAINPWQWWFDTTATGNQNGLINITTYKSDNPAVEHKITHGVAGYGMQLDLIEEVLAVVLSTIPVEKITGPQKKTLDKFNRMMADIRTAKEKNLLEEFSLGSVDALLSRLDRLKDKDPVLYQKLAERLKKAL